MSNNFIGKLFSKTKRSSGPATNLAQARINKQYTIKSIETHDEDLQSFLFTLGCYEGEAVTIISVLAENYVIAVKDARYSIDKDLAKAIII